MEATNKVILDNLKKKVEVYGKPWVKQLPQYYGLLDGTKEVNWRVTFLVGMQDRDHPTNRDEGLNDKIRCCPDHRY